MTFTTPSADLKCRTYRRCSPLEHQTAPSFWFEVVTSDASKVNWKLAGAFWVDRQRCSPENLLLVFLSSLRFPRKVRLFYLTAALQWKSPKPECLLT